ncbi:MAG: NAD(P)H-dependent oxidoreductase subunit E [Candidatus Symbiobacter sp.]|nr:NAD(P)H-dependent oxidoreductase subunit E [Candidatus Symbiobacter sp.]
MTQYVPFDALDAKSFLASKLPPLLSEGLSDGPVNTSPPAAPPQAERTVSPLEGSQALSSAVIPLLHLAQERYGYIDDALVPVLADLVNRSRAEIHGVVTFYHDFRRTPPAQMVVRICLAEACQAMGSDALATAAKQQCRTDFHHNSADEKYRLEPVYCFGNCACAPSVMIDDRLYGRADATKLAAWVKGAGTQPGMGRA